MSLLGLVPRGARRCLLGRLHPGVGGRRPRTPRRLTAGTGHGHRCAGQSFPSEPVGSARRCPLARCSGRPSGSCRASCRTASNSRRCAGFPLASFGVMMSMEPAVAALAGLVILSEQLTGRQWAGVGCVIVACVAVTLGRRAALTPGVSVEFERPSPNPPLRTPELSGSGPLDVEPREDGYEHRQSGTSRFPTTANGHGTAPSGCPLRAARLQRPRAPRPSRTSARR